MTDGIQETYRALGDLPRGDALKAQRAVTADGTEAVIKTVRPVAPDMFMAAVARLSAVAGPPQRARAGLRGSGYQFVSVATQPVTGINLGEVLAGAASPRP